MARRSEGPREVKFKTSDGGEISADLYEGGDHGVVLAHGRAFDKESWRDFADRLSAGGHTVLAIDFRGYGKSKKGSSEGALHLDVLAAVRHLKKAGARKVSVIGASMGGGAAARAATEVQEGEIYRLILLSPVSIPHPESIRAGGVFYIASREEAMAEGVRAQYEHAHEPKWLELLNGNAHAQKILETAEGVRITKVILDFLAGKPE